MDACRNAGVPYIELPIAFDALTVVVNPQNTWAKDITFQTKPEVKAFVDFYLKNASTLVKSLGYVPLLAEGYRLGEVHFHRGKIGTVFDGKAQFNLTLGELLGKQEKF